MTEISPLVPSYVELSNFPYMPLDVQRLLTSETWILAADEPIIGYALINLWCESWHQKPAASIPANESVLSRLSNVDRANWRQISREVLKGWVLCSDGRYYHRVVAEKALECWLERTTLRYEGLKGISKRWGNESSQEIKMHLEQIHECELLLAAINPNSKWFKKHPLPTVGNAKNEISTTNSVGSNLPPNSHLLATSTVATHNHVGGNTSPNRGAIRGAIVDNELGKNENNSIETSGNANEQGQKTQPETGRFEGEKNSPPISPPPPPLIGSLLQIQVEPSYCAELENPSSTPDEISIPVGDVLQKPKPALQEEFALLQPEQPIQPVVNFPLPGDKSYPLYEADVKELEPLYPAADVTAELRKMVGWLLARPKERKTERGILRFVHSWLARAQDSASVSRGRTAQERGGKLTEGKWSGFQKKDYRKGINEDGSF